MIIIGKILGNGTSAQVRPASLAGDNRFAAKSFTVTSVSGEVDAKAGVRRTILVQRLKIALKEIKALTEVQASSPNAPISFAVGHGKFYIVWEALAVLLTCRCRHLSSCCRVRQPMAAR